MAGLLETVSISFIPELCVRPSAGVWQSGMGMRDVRRGGAGVLGGGGQLDLDAVDAVDAVDEEDQDKDKGDLQPILDLSHDGVLGDEAGRGGC